MHPIEDRYALHLYVVGTTPTSARAIVNLRKLCEAYLPGRYDLEVVDLSREPRRAATAQVIAAPTLVKSAPPPMRRFIGDLSDVSRILDGLGANIAAPHANAGASRP